MSVKTALDALAEKEKFKIVDTDNKSVRRVVFEDGRAYRFEFPYFKDFHDVFTSEGNLETQLFYFGLTRFEPENKKSPKIDDNYLEAHMTEGINLWSPLLRGLLCLPPT